jgi:hypothetical protein
MKIANDDSGGGGVGESALDVANKLESQYECNYLVSFQYNCSHLTF